MIRYPLRELADLKPGDHVCCLYETEEEHRAVLTPFLREGLEQGQKVLYVVDAYTAVAILGYLRKDGVDVEPYLASGQLVVITSDDAYLRGGTFDLYRMIGLLRTETERAVAEGYPALRVSGEMTWILKGLPGSETFIEYEAKLNTFLPNSKCLALCQYDRRRFNPAVLLDMLICHPVIVVGTRVYENFYFFIGPDEFLGPDRPEIVLRNSLKTLAERRRVEDALQKARDELEIRVLERTADLAKANEQLLITGIRVKEEAEVAQRRTAELQATLDNMVDGVFVCDVEGRIILTNDAAIRLLGLLSPEDVDRVLRESPGLLRVRHPDGRPVADEERPLARAMAGETVVEEDEIVYNLEAQRDVYLRTSAAPIRDGTGKIVGAVAVARDVTEFVELDQLKDQFISVAAQD
ncbi:MAG: MEDS domain-containing protein [Chloroflexi bacterium]|nr:MEDS domain-containing protein [Chloroflexota bacterium]